MTLSNVHDLLVPSSHNLTFPTGFKDLPEEERIAAISSLLRHLNSSADPLLHHRPATNDQG